MQPNDPKWQPQGSWLDNGPVEPSAVQRDAAKQTFALYRAFCDAGFSEQQALHLVVAACLPRR